MHKCISILYKNMFLNFDNLIYGNFKSESYYQLKYIFISLSLMFHNTQYKKQLECVRIIFKTLNFPDYLTF